MADDDRADDRARQGEPTGAPGDRPPRGTSTPAVGGSKAAEDAEEVESMGTGTPPDNAAGRSVNNPDVGPSS